MRNVEVTLEQRLRLSLLVGEQKGTVSQIRLWSAVLAKIELSKEENQEISLNEVETPGGRRLLWNQGAARAIGTIGFENDEARAIAALLASHPGFSAADLAWVDALLHSLDRN